MAAQLRNERFFAAAKANIVRRGEWSRPIESGAAPGWDAWDPPVDADQVHVVPCLLGIMATSTSRWLDSVDESEDEDVAVIIRDQRSEPVTRRAVRTTSTNATGLFSACVAAVPNMRKSDVTAPSPRAHDGATRIGAVGTIILATQVPIIGL